MDYVLAVNVDMACKLLLVARYTEIWRPLSLSDDVDYDPSDVYVRGARFEFLVVSRFSAAVQTVPGAHPAFYTVGNWSLSRG
jgi:hypothetical protein